MISYLSTPLKSEVQSYQENIDLISKVATYKQSRYDQVVDTMLQKQNDLLNIDVSFAPPEVQSEKENLLKRADDELNELAKVDLLNPENINKAEAIFEPIVNNDKIILGAQYTKQVRENQATYDEWRKKKPEFYNSANEAYSMQEASKAKNMSFKDFKENYQNFDIQAIQFRDIDKEFREAAKTLGVSLSTTTMMSDEQGMYLLTDKNEKIYAKDVMAVLPNDAGILAQAKVNAWSSMGNVTQGELLQSRKDIYLTQYNDTKELNQSLLKTNDDIKTKIADIKAYNDKGKLAVAAYSQKYNGVDFSKPENREALIKELEKEIQSNNSIVQTNQKQLDSYTDYMNQLDELGAKPLSEKELLSLKTQYYLEQKKHAYGEAYKKDVREIKAEVDPYMKMQKEFEKSVALKQIEHQNAMEEKMMQAELDLLTGKNKPSGDNGEIPTVGGALIPDVPSESNKNSNITYEGINSEIIEIQKTVGTSELGEDGSLFKDFASGSGTATGNTNTTEFFKTKVKEFKDKMLGYKGDDKALSSDGHLTYGEVKGKYQSANAYLTQRALLQAEAIMKQNLIDEITEKNVPNNSKFQVDLFREAEYQRLLKIDPQIAAQYKLDNAKSTYSYNKEKANNKLEKLNFGTMSTKLVPVANENSKDPAKSITEAAKNQIVSAVPKLDKTKIDILNFEYKNGNWVVNYRDKAMIDTDESHILSRDFVARFAQDLSVAQTIEIYKYMVAQHNYNNSGDTYANPNKNVISPPIVINGISWNLLIDNATSPGNIKIGKTTDEFENYQEVKPEQAIGFLTKGNSSQLSATQEIFEAIKEKYGLK